MGQGARFSYLYAELMAQHYYFFSHSLALLISFITRELPIIIITMIIMIGLECSGSIYSRSKSTLFMTYTKIMFFSFSLCVFSPSLRFNGKHHNQWDGKLLFLVRWLLYSLKLEESVWSMSIVYYPGVVTIFLATNK